MRTSLRIVCFALHKNIPDACESLNRSLSGTPSSVRRFSDCSEPPSPTDKTVVLTGHFDVVDTQNCGDKVQTAFDLERYTEALREQPLDETARKDLESGNWLFGRGSMDMKAGPALFLASMEEWADDPTLAVNILFWAVPDEEANSAGMIGSLKNIPAYL